VRGLPVAQPWQQPQANHANAGADGDLPGGVVAQRRHAVLPGAQGGFGAEQQPRASIGQPQRAVFAQKQGLANGGFQLADLPADGGLAQTQRLSGAGHAQRAPNHDKTGQDIQWGQAFGHGG
jgi:hypothetical protein